MTTQQKIENIIEGTRLLVDDLIKSGELTQDKYISIMECQNSSIVAVLNKESIKD